MLRCSVCNYYIGRMCSAALWKYLERLVVSFNSTGPSANFLYVFPFTHLWEWAAFVHTYIWVNSCSAWFAAIGRGLLTGSRGGE